jgi:LacI family transcriptional regulator
MMKTTIKDVAKAANVSVATASMAINGKKGVNEQTKRNVLKVAEELCYVPNHSARSLVTNDSNCIGLMVPEIVNPFYSAIVDIMTKLTEERGYIMLLGISNSKRKQEKAYVETFASRNALGVIIVPMLREYPNTDYLGILQTSNIPMVFCTESYPAWTDGTKAGIPCVMTDFEKGEFEMTRYLVSRGLRKICFVGSGWNVQFAKLRLNGFRRAFEEAGIAVDERNLFFLEEPRFQNAYDITDRVMERKPEAIVCINDIMTIGIMKRLNELGVKIPAELSVAGFDNMMFAELAQKPITTVGQPLQKICSMTMEILDGQIRKGVEKSAPKDPRVYRIEPELVIRDTTK